MFGLFKLKSNNFVGIDFGTSAIKIVELSLHDEKIELENYGWADLGAVFQIQDNRQMKMQSYEDKIRQCLGDLLKKMGLENKSVYLAIPGFSGLITLIEFPEMKTEELEKAIHFESHKYIPSSIEEIAMSWEIVGKRDVLQSPADAALAPNGATKKIQVLLVAAPKKEISKYDRLVSGSELTVNAIELETFSIARALVGEDAGNFLIVDVGSRATNIILTEKGIVKVNRNIDAGGNEITNTIAESMNISKQRAEILKRGEKDFINNRETSIVIPVLELISGECLRILSSYREKNKESRIDAVIVSGGTAKMKGVDQYFSNALGIKAMVANPWRRITFDEKLTPFVNELGASYSVAIGLALRGIEEYKRK